MILLKINNITPTFTSKYLKKEVTLEMKINNITPTFTKKIYMNINKINS